MANGSTASNNPIAEYHVGLDVGSTTTKAVVVNTKTKDIVFSTYRRHYAHQIESLREVLGEIQNIINVASVQVAMSGSGGKAIADYLDIPYIQEVVANSLAVRDQHPGTRCAIELGGQDAKMIFFDTDPETGVLTVSDMRMNGSCAGGTGAFIDEIAALLKIPVTELNDYAAKGTTVYDISGRCGVYAKTDIQPLLNAGARKEDLALSTFHAIAKQTLGGLAQGLDIHAPVIFEGGPLTFNPTLVDVFTEQLALSGSDTVKDDQSEIIVARGTALSLSGMFKDTAEITTAEDILNSLEGAEDAMAAQALTADPFFHTEGEASEFKSRHALPAIDPAWKTAKPGETLRVYLGIDSGSTTTKFALIDENENLVDEFYSSNEGEPLDIATSSLSALHKRYDEKGIKLEILGCGTTGYGEKLFAHAFHADHHIVETVAHSRAAMKYEPEASFVLDIGGQDMKAIWLDDGIVTNIVVNEACSSGCGSFLEGFAKSLNIPMEDIASSAFSSNAPAKLGSRCTVFMNSSVVTEQKNGKSPADIMAGLCQSIIENVFTKVIRVSNLKSLGDHIVVQGGTFRNDAVLAAFENYIGKRVTRAPYPGLMGAIGIALLTKEKMEEQCLNKEVKSSFIGLESIDAFSYEQQGNVVCELCGNHCRRTLLTFNDGSTFVTGNRCERGEIIGNPKDAEVKEQIARAKAKRDSVPNLFKTRQALLFKDYPHEQICKDRNITIGFPRVLAFWDNAPFWKTLFTSLGFKVRFSRLSNREMYEDGLSAVASDTVCFPAKLVHGHIRDLAKMGVDRIFMPEVTTVESENTESTSQSMCAVVKGYPMVIRNSDNPEERFGIPYDDPLFHWYTQKDKEKQLSQWMREKFGISQRDTLKAIEQADAAQHRFAQELLDEGSRVLDEVEKRDSYAVVLASRPYHNDPLVNHDLPDMYTQMGIPVLTPDAVPGINDVDLHNSLIDIVNNFHARMLGSAAIAAQDPHLEYTQVVSFGCGHDAYLSDEIIRIMKEIGNKTPLVLKVDESDASGPLHIRVRSFIETTNQRRKEETLGHRAYFEPRELQDPYPQKYVKSDRKKRVVLVPNTSHAFSRLMAAAFSKQGAKAVPLPIGRERAIALGKQYVHNDICFPAQIVIGEALAELETGKYDNCDVAIGMAKYIGDCRLTHYSALLRKALDDAGYEDVPIITNDDVDYHNLHPGYKFSLASAVRVALVLPMIDVLEELVRKIRPYELVEGSANEAFERAVDEVIEGLEKHGSRGAEAGFKKAIEIMSAVGYDRSNPRPTVLIVGEYLLNFHPGANHDIEDYLENNGFEIIEARMTDVIRKTYFYRDAQIKEYKLDASLKDTTWYAIANGLFEHAHNVTDKIAKAHPLYKPAARMPEIVKASDPIIHHTFDAGEGVLIPAEILHHAKNGCRAFLILQPFGCLPNHVVGRGIAKKLKELYPQAQILPLDYDPDVSFANLENRLQMLVMNAEKDD